MRWSIEAKTTIGFATAFLLIVLVGVIAYGNARAFIDTNQWVVHTRTVLEELEDTLVTITDAETGQRGYLLTGDESYLAPYTNATAAIDGQLERLQTLITDNPSQQVNLDALADLITQRFSSIEATLQVFREQGLEAAREAIQSGSGKQIMDQIRALITKMRDEETRLLEARTADSNARAQSTLFTFGLLSAMLLALLAFIYYIMRRDLSGRRRVEKALKSERTLLRTVIDTIPDLIYIKDTKGRFMLLNRALARMIGEEDLDKIIGTTVLDWFPEEQARQYTADERTILASHQPLIGREETASTDQGEVRLMLTTKIPVFNPEGEIVQIVGISSDITQRREAEQAIRQLNQTLQQQTERLGIANKELEAFTYSVSHDLRAPLRAIDGFSGILVNKHADTLPPDAQRHLQRVRVNAQKMGALIDDLLAFSRLSRQTINKRTVQLADLARQVLSEDLRAEQENREVEIVIGDLPPCEADPNLLRQVLINLLSNALKFTRNCEHARIEVSSETRDGQIAYYVRDNGAGFDMQYADKLFGVFQRLHSMEDYEGTGVGLAIVHRVIHRHGGRVWAEAEKNKGATFYFTLAGEATDDPDEMEMPEPANPVNN